MKEEKKYLKKFLPHKKKRIYNALLNSKSEEVLNFDSVLSKILNG